jgi:DNA-binding GntR family transcriptional regulator
MSGLPPIQPLPTAAQRAADLIRQYIFEGRFAPGTPLPEASLAAALRVSRNTVREAFRTLMSEHLLIHQPHKGVTVSWLTADDVLDIYKIRRMFELSVLDLAAQGQLELAKNGLGEIGTLIAEAETAAANGDWAEVGTANLRFHGLLVEMHHSERINDTFRRLMTELRLGFLAHEDPASFHGPFLARNRRIYELMMTGELDDARNELTRYLDDAEQDVMRAVQ